MWPLHPAADRLHLDMLCWTAGAETSERGIHRRACRVRSSRLPSLPQLSRSYDLPPPPASTRSLRMPTEQGRPARESTIRCWLIPSVLRQDGLTPTPTIVRQERFAPLFMGDLL